MKFTIYEWLHLFIIMLAGFPLVGWLEANLDFVWLSFLIYGCFVFGTGILFRLIERHYERQKTG